MREEELVNKFVGYTVYFQPSWLGIYPILNSIKSHGFEVNICMKPDSFIFTISDLYACKVRIVDSNYLRIRERVYEGIINFIKWYNEQDKKSNSD